MIKIGGKDILLVDSHTHVWEKFAGRRFGNCPVELMPFGKAKQDGKISSFLTPEYSDSKVRIEVLMGYMEMHNVDKAVIIQNPCYGDQREYVHDIVENNNDRFVGIGMIDPREKDSVGEEIDILVKEYNFKGIKLEIPDVPFIMDDPDYDFMWKKIVSNDAVAVIDLGWGDGPYDYNIDRLRNVVKKYPDMKMVLPHLGVSRLWDLNQKYPFETMQQTLSLLDINKNNLWFDLSAIQKLDEDDEYPYCRDQKIIKAVNETHGMERIMWGTDFPTELKYASYKEILNMVVRHCDFLTKNDLEMILGKNALEVYFK